ncbi:AraC family transcriptional regulator [Xenophilus sp. Marseille-Q4582]|uniref:AraC family transcriptional regulator n=1 Tax=Xenophilus sp. Marseille-Q4582 TaxID=2866600 RepID=UPI001CE41E40|nr:AraC family transcriptional regulator [Xenophilus sp. Marseille-Q4582]
MLDQSSSLAASAQVGTLPPVPPDRRDLLTRILLGLRLDGVEYGRCILQAPWAVRFPAQREARFHFVASGGGWLRVEGGDWLRLAPGDAVLLPRGSAHVLASAPGLQPTDVQALPRVPVSEQVYVVRGAGPGRGGEEGAGAAPAAPDVLFCGTLRFNLDPLHPLLALMPELMRADELARRNPGVPALLDAMEREVAMDRIGSCGILARLADVLAASIIRAWVECACNDATGWLAAVQCPRIGQVIAAIHAEPERDWRVPALADLMGVSRSRFAEAFTRTVGESPARYVAKVKMFQARRWIAQEGMRVTVAANRLGYDSEASFSRAFKRIVGQPPSALKGEPAHRPVRVGGEPLPA